MLCGQFGMENLMAGDAARLHACCVTAIRIGQDLKDKFRDCGSVVYANVMRSEDGRNARMLWD